MKRAMCLLSVAVLFAGGLEVRAQSQHTNVGTILIPAPPCGPGCPRLFFQFCSGSLVHERVFMTAGHCMANLDFIINVLNAFSINDVYVSFDEDPGTVNLGDPVPATWKSITDFHAHPDFYFTQSAGDQWRNVNDIGLMVLANAVPASEATPVVLPGLGLFAPSNTGVNHARDYTLVGYGAETTLAPPGTVFTGTRREAHPQFQGSVGRYAFMQQNPASGNSGACFGDSGAPIFTEINGQMTVVAIVSGGDLLCLTHMWAYRLDLADAQNYIASTIMSLP